MENYRKQRKPSELLKVKQIIRLCEKSNIARIKYENIEIEFREKKIRQSKDKFEKYEADNGEYLKNPMSDMPPDDVMLFAATPHFDNILEERKAVKKG